MRAALPANETDRLETLHKSGLLDSSPEQAYDDITLLASYICGTPIAVVSLVDAERQWFKSSVGLDGSETPRDVSFCAHTILQPDTLLVVPDARLDSRFSDNSFVVNDPHIRFYAGAPLVTPEGHALGTLCVVDLTPRQLNDAQIHALQALARQVMAHITLRGQAQEMQRLNNQLERLSVRDELTGINNRRAFDIALQREIARAQHYNSPLSLVLLDVDAFKSYNDSFGHQEGDRVLRMVGSVLAQHIEDQVNDMAVAARYGGEEFALILPDTPAEAAMCIAEQVRIAFEQAVWPRRAVTASFGVATTTPEMNTVAPETLVALADQALYLSKHSGRNRVTHACH
jgi:diguanylate cyclase (GGDEF)-like protein